MPELPEVETVRRGLESHLAGRILERVDVIRGDLRYPIPDLGAALRGQRVLSIERRAKYLLFFFNGVLLSWHLGMTGHFHVLSRDVPAAAHEHVRFLFDDGKTLRYRDPRRFGYAGLLPLQGWRQHPWFRDMGPEPLGDEFTPEYLAHCCGKRRISIKQILMDARVVVGIGNIYACESLFRAHIHPVRAANRISDSRLQQLVREIRQVLMEAINAGGSSISDFVCADGKPGYFAHSFRVYGRAGKVCLDCGGEIRRIVQAGRGTFFCPACQR